MYAIQSLPPNSKRDPPSTNRFPRNHNFIGGDLIAVVFFFFPAAGTGQTCSQKANIVVRDVNGSDLCCFPFP